MRNFKKSPKAILITLSIIIATAALAATIVGANGTFTTSVSSNGRITTTYTPTPGTPTCSSIYMVQTCRDVDQNGNKIEPKSYQGKTFDHLQDDMTSGGTYIDHVVCEADPYYNGEDQGKDDKSEGSRSSSSSTPTTMSDKPRYSDSCFPNGVTTIVSTFEVCAVCKDDERILDCYTWTYTRVKGDGTDGTVVSGTTPGTGSQEFKDAYKKFKTNHYDNLICPEEIAELFQQIDNLLAGNGKKIPENPLPDTPFQMTWDVVNVSGVDAFNVEYEFLVDGMPLEGGMIVEIPYFDFANVTLEIPPLPEGPHVVELIIDPMNLIEEYNEADNMSLEEFVISGLSPVQEDEPESRFFMRMLQPNPTDGNFKVMLSLGSDTPAHLMVLDIRGRLVLSRNIYSVPGQLHTENFNLDASLGAGMYFLRLEQGSKVETRKFMLLR